MLGRSAACLLAIVVVAPALAGCTNDEAPAARDDGETLRPGSAGGAAPGGSATTGTATTSSPPVKSPAQRWHFHDHWKGEPTITLVNRTLELNATQRHDGLPALSALVELDPGVIVPPETGTLRVSASWTGTEGGALNLTYRPADSSGFHPGGDIGNGGNVSLSVTESNADVPHRAASLWAWNLTAVPAGTPPTLPPREVSIVITATIGRPLFIDPPHVDWWQGATTAPLVLGATGTIDAARTPAGNLTLPPAAGGAQQPPKPADATRPVRVPVDEGRIVPEGAKTIIVLLNWTTDLPDAKLAVHYRELNLPSSGPMLLAKDGPTSRVFAVEVDPHQTDTTYSNRTTWEFDVVPDGDAAAFRGSFTLYAWVARVEQDAALRETIGA